MNRHFNASGRKRGRNAIVATLACVLLAAWFLGRAGAVQNGPGMRAPHEPQQQNLSTLVGPFRRNGFNVVPVARFSLDARVLGREDYRFDTGAEISPMDLALGWGRMSDSAVVERLDLSQGDRWWRWHSRRLPIPAAEINRSAANMHMIPANDDVAAQLERVREGDVVDLRGYLVEVSRARDGWHWESSMSRTDTGKGACELVWVESLRIH